LGRFQAVVFGNVIAPEEELLVKLLFVCFQPFGGIILDDRQQNKLGI
jgi:hypothetical protein